MTYDGLNVNTLEGDHLGRYTTQAGEAVTSDAQDLKNRMYAIQANLSGRTAPVFFTVQDQLAHTTVNTVGEPTTAHGMKLGNAMTIYRDGDGTAAGVIGSAINPSSSPSA